VLFGTTTSRFAYGRRGAHTGTIHPRSTYLTSPERGGRASGPRRKVALALPKIHIVRFDTRCENRCLSALNFVVTPPNGALDVATFLAFLVSVAPSAPRLPARLQKKEKNEFAKNVNKLGQHPIPVYCPVRPELRAPHWLFRQIRYRLCAQARGYSRESIRTK
jgi:hypothetical protein